ncbi:Uncharacterised protein [Catenibacterium mitsuokai]|nr:Uncharacterised protein [Catenibacterium mitsuokai]
MFPIETITNASLYAKTKASLFNNYPFFDDKFIFEFKSGMTIELKR